MGIYALSPFHKIPAWGGLQGKVIKASYQFYIRKTGEIPFSASLLGFKDKAFKSYLEKSNAYSRIKHRLRMVLLYLYAELENRLVVGAANKSEYQIGFFVKHGCDDASDIMPLLNLYKTQVRELAHYLNIPSRIIQKPPSPDLIPGLTTEEALGISYEKMDLILLALEKNWEITDITKALEIKEDKIIAIQNLRQKTEHLRKIFIPKND